MIQFRTLYPVLSDVVVMLSE